MTQQGAVLVQVECAESLRLSRALLGVLPGSDRYYAEQTPDKISLTLGRYAGKDFEDFERWLDRSLENQLDLLPRFRGTCIQLSDEARPFPNPRMPLMGSLATPTLVGSAPGGFGGTSYGGFGGGSFNDAQTTMPQRNTNFATDYDAASSILASVGSGGVGGLGLGFGGSGWGTGGSAFGGGVFSTSPVATGTASQTVGSFSSGALSSSASSALGGGVVGPPGFMTPVGQQQTLNTKPVGLSSAAAVVAGTAIGGGMMGGNKPAPPLGPRPVGLPGFTSGLGPTLVSPNPSNLLQQQRPTAAAVTAMGQQVPRGSPSAMPPTAPRPTSWASIAKSTAAVLPESAVAPRPPTDAIPQPQVPKGPPPPSNFRTFHQPTDPSSIAHSTRPGDWYCDGCGAHNFASRGICFKCKEMKKNITHVPQPETIHIEREFVPPPPLGNPPAAARQVGDYSDEGDNANVYSQHNSGDATAALRPGDWLCVGCRAHNFASRGACFRCKSRKVGQPTTGSGGGSEASGAQLNQQQREQRDDDSDRGGFPMRTGDWLCDGCQAHNFASRNNCFKCKKDCTL